MFYDRALWKKENRREKKTSFNMITLKKVKEDLVLRQQEQDAIRQT